MIDEVLKLGGLPKQNKRASNAAEREENQLAKRYSKLKSSLSADIRRALGQLTPASAASGAGSASQPAAGRGLRTNTTSAEARAFLLGQIGTTDSDALTQTVSEARGSCLCMEDLPNDSSARAPATRRMRRVAATSEQFPA